MRLKIENPNKLEGREWWNGRFICTWSVETDQSYRFQFKDTQSPSTRYIWIELSRFGSWDNSEDKWMYSLNYPNVTAHFVSADYLSDMNNTIWTMGEALKKFDK